MSTGMKVLKILLLALLFSLLLLPYIQSRLPLVREPALFGIYAKTGPPDLKQLKWKSWSSGQFQEELSRQVRDHQGFRNTLIRFNNQVDYSLFRIIHAEGFIAGRNGYLYEEDYIHEYTGRYFIGKKTLDLKVRRLKAVQEALRKQGVCLLPVIEPGKASFYPEYIPACYHPEKRTLTNLEYMKQRLDAWNVDYLDLDAWFLSMKDTSRYKLFPEYGMHWSIHSVSLVVDTLSRYLRSRCDLDLPGFSIERIETTGSLRGSDRDIADMLNLVFPLKKVTATYPVIRFDSAEPVLKVIAVADSYFNNIYYDYTPHLFANTEYWYYNSTLYYKDSYGDTRVDHSGLPEKFRNVDLILLMTSEINAHCGFWNFVDQSYEALFPATRDTWCYRYENKIRNDRYWFRGMVRQAASERTTLEQAIKRNAAYAMCVDFDTLENKTHYDSVQRIIYNIRTTPKWFHKVWSVSKEQNLPLEACLESEAEYVLSMRNP